MDADLQNPPEEISKLLAAMDAGTTASAACAASARLVVPAAGFARDEPVARADHPHPHDRSGVHAAAYSREIAAAVAASREVSTFIPALAYTFASNPTEVDVAHAGRVAGKSHYPLYKLIRLDFDLITGFSLVPLQLFSMFGMLVSAVALATYVVVIVVRLSYVHWEDAAAVFWDRDILAFFLVGMLLSALGSSASMSAASIIRSGHGRVT